MEKKVAVGQLQVGLRKEFTMSNEDFIGKFHELSIQELYITVTLNNGEVHKIPAFFPEMHWDEFYDENDIEE